MSAKDKLIKAVEIAKQEGMSIYGLIFNLKVVDNHYKFKEHYACPVACYLNGKEVPEGLSHFPDEYWAAAAYYLGVSERYVSDFTKAVDDTIVEAVDPSRKTPGYLAGLEVCSKFNISRCYGTL